MITVGLADDQQLIRVGLRTLLESEGDLQVAWEVENGQEALEQTRRSPPDVVLMDIRMPVLDGINALRQIAVDPALAGVHVVVLTTFESDEHVFAALRAGAAGFLVKNAEPADLIRAVRLAAAGESLLSPTVARRVIDDYRERPDRQPTRTHPGLAELTDREREILALIGEGLNNDEIGKRLYISPATARTHVGRAMTKLGARDRAQLVVIAYQSGLVV